MRGSCGRLLIYLATASVTVGCGGVEGYPTAEESVEEASQALTAHCTVKVNGVGMIDVEKNYLPHVVHCENGGAPYEALKVQAIAARTYLYYKLLSADSIDDGQNAQVYSCGSGPSAMQIKAVQETAGQVIRHDNITICSFYVAGDPTLSPPGCVGNDGDAATEKYVTYNNGLSGDAVHPSSLGSSSSPYNRGCMSQWGTRCLSNAGKTAPQMLKFYYGADIDIVTATGSCIGPDGDGDGVVDASDNCPKLANAGQTDTDNDKTGDACDNDDDGDSVSDANDNCPKVSNDGQVDTDADGKGNACDGDDDNDNVADANDNCPKVKNGGQVDTDGDKSGDACDTDDDNDGVLDTDDNCRTVKNAGQADADMDGKGDSCEVDNDDDGLLDASDNCKNIANPEQEDIDADGKGDVCDTDDDADGIDDASDNCPALANVDQLDKNGDGIGDGCQSDLDEDGVVDPSDNCPAFENPGQEDIDGDGIGDVCADADADGVPDITDDCPDDVNQDQADIDQDGLGDACDSVDDRAKPEPPAPNQSASCSMAIPSAPTSPLHLAFFALLMSSLGLRRRRSVK
jgi:hypothetical protein